MRGLWVLVAVASCGGPGSPPAYPSVARGAIADDPYRGLEDMDAPATKAWLAAQNQRTDATLGAVAGRAELHARLAQLLARERSSHTVHRGDRYFWDRRDADHDQATIQVAASADGPATMLFDPSAIAKDGSVQLAGWMVSSDGAILAVGLSTGGGDWTRWKFRDVATGADLPDELPDTKYYHPAFTADHSGVYYSRFPTPVAGKELTETDHDCKLYFHKLGTPIAEDRVVMQAPDDPARQYQPEVSPDGHYLVIEFGDGEVGDSNMERIAIQDLTIPHAPIVPVIDRDEGEYWFIANVGTTLYFLTDIHAPHQKVIAVDAAAPTNVRDVIPDGPHPIEAVVLAGGQLIVESMADAHAELAAYDPLGTKLRDIPLPSVGAVYGMTGRPQDPEAFFAFTSFTAPFTTYRLDIASGQLAAWHAAPAGFDAASFETRQVFFPSADGTKVPMFITAKAGLALDGTHPTLMTGYGFGGISLMPYFSPMELAWIERGGVAVTVNVRGGGEYGTDWHHAGWRDHEQTKFDDFAAAARWLIANKWTSAAHLGAYGTSGGGMLMGVIVTQHSELFGAVAPIAGVLDLLRFHLFGQGAGWQGDLGHPDVPVEGAWLRKISPLHNVRAGTRYPATFIVTSDHDVRVPPLHSYKFAAAMQAAQAAPAPILLRVETESGHGGGGLRSQQADQETELLLFFSKFLGP